MEVEVREGRKKWEEWRRKGKKNEKRRKVERKIKRRIS